MKTRFQHGSTMRSPDTGRAKRGVTLVEMLVSVALLVLIMTIIVQVFAGATGAMSTAKAFAELDQNLRKLSSTIRKDLEGATARFTPPLNPKDNLGYFEYGENSFADIQGEDCDDYFRLTVKAPEGEYFTGRMFAPFQEVTGSPSQAQINNYLNSQPITIRSQHAEVIYFLRNNNLYRRVLLVVPERQSSLIPDFPIVATGGAGNTKFFTSAPFTVDLTQNPPTRLATSWQGLNDLSAHPSPVTNNGGTLGMIVLNTLGDLTNRENRFAHPRFHSDLDSPLSNGSPDGLPDDFNSDSGGNIIGDGIPDYYPTLYPEVFNVSAPLINDVSQNAIRGAMPQAGYAFPFIYPGAYSRPDANSSGVGWIHSPDPSNDQSSIPALNALNHNPLLFGDSLPTPPGTFSTWWGFPTWRETMSTNWGDPAVNLTNTTAQPNFLTPVHDISAFPGTNLMLPPMTAAFRVNPELYNDGLGDTTLTQSGTGNADASLSGALWLRCWEDDLLMTGVRSFDVKAHDDAFNGYVDLGWGDDLRLYTAGTSIPNSPPYLTSTLFYPTNSFEWPIGSYRYFNMVGGTFAHEGRIPPLVADNRLDAQYPNPGYDPNNVVKMYQNYPNYTSNIGDDANTVIRLRRVWDSWSTAYSNAPATGLNPETGQPVGPPFRPPVYPSYPAPYPAPLRGIRIQIHVVDPKDEHVKSLTIIQDFTDKL